MLLSLLQEKCKVLYLLLELKVCKTYTQPSKSATMQLHLMLGSLATFNNGQSRVLPFSLGGAHAPLTTQQQICTLGNHVSGWTLHKKKHDVDNSVCCFRIILPRGFPLLTSCKYEYVSHNPPPLCQFFLRYPHTHPPQLPFLCKVTFCLTCSPKSKI